MADFILLMVSAILINNILLAGFLGTCPFVGISRSMDSRQEKTCDSCNERTGGEIAQKTGGRQDRDKSDHPCRS